MPGAGGRADPGSIRLSLPSLSWRAGTVAMCQRAGQDRRNVTLRRSGRAPGRSPQKKPHSNLPDRSPRSRSAPAKTCGFTRRFSTVPAVDDTVLSEVGLSIGPVLGRCSLAREAVGQQRMRASDAGADPEEQAGHAGMAQRGQRYCKARTGCYSVR